MTHSDVLGTIAMVLWAAVAIGALIHQIGLKVARTYQRATCKDHGLWNIEAHTACPWCPSVRNGEMKNDG